MACLWQEESDVLLERVRRRGERSLSSSRSPGAKRCLEQEWLHTTCGAMQQPRGGAGHGCTRCGLARLRCDLPSESSRHFPTSICVALALDMVARFFLLATAFCAAGAYHGAPVITTHRRAANVVMDWFNTCTLTTSTTGYDRTARRRPPFAEDSPLALAPRPAPWAPPTRRPASPRRGSDASTRLARSSRVS